MFFFFFQKIITVSGVIKLRVKGSSINILEKERDEYIEVCHVSQIAVNRFSFFGLITITGLRP